MTTPYLYGLDSFENEGVVGFATSEKEQILPTVLKKKTSYEFRANWAFLRNAVAMIAAVALFFFMSTPVENTYIEKGNYARLLPTDLFEKIEKQSVAMTPVMLKSVDAIPQTKPQLRRKSRPLFVKHL